VNWAAAGSVIPRQARKEKAMATPFKGVVPVLAVDDIDRSLTFYRDVLGFTAMDAGEPGTCYLSSGDGTDLLIYRSTFGRGETTALNFFVDDVRRTVDDLRGKGVRFEDYDLPGLKTVDGVADDGRLQGAWFKDPDGNTLAISNDLRQKFTQAA
jgi:catechol 2,3-dioxygenase-like lactoylglutathione lyase family enzyme